MRRLDSIMNPLVDRMSVAVLSSAANEIAPRFVAEGREVVATGSGKRRSPPQAREYLQHVLDDALSVRDDVTAEADTIMIADLIRAIREAERNDPLPPAAMARAA